jgi:hypothetical protein
MAKYQGEELDLGGKKYVVPPISLGMLRNGAMEKMERHDKLLEENKFNESMIVRGEIILSALRRNYTEGELSDEEFWAGIDMRNMVNIWPAILGRSGFAAPGETQAARETTTSGPSTQPSPPPTDGQ